MHLLEILVISPHLDNAWKSASVVPLQSRFCRICTMADKIPARYSTENSEDPVAVLKFFTPDSSWTWYVAEYDPEQRLAFGLVIGHERERGYFSFTELDVVPGPMGLPVERDLHVEPTPISKCR